MEDIIIYPRFYKCATLAEFKLLDTKCCVLLGLPNDESTNNYANPILDIKSNYYIVVNTEIASLFTKEEIAEMIQYDEIVLPIVNQ